MTTLSARGLNRATLDRQFLLRRHPLTAQEAVRRLAGLQGQAPLAPYVGLWCRLSGFEPGELSDLIDRRVLVRAPAMRGTVHVLWKVTRSREAADLAVTPFRALTTEEEAGITREAAGLLEFTCPGLAPGIRFLPPA